jgi:hypothetical protein
MIKRREFITLLGGAAPGPRGARSFSFALGELAVKLPPARGIAV